MENKTIVKTDIQIAQSADIRPIREIADKIAIEEEDLEYYGRYKAKIPLKYINEEKIKKSKDQIKTFEQTVHMIKKELDEKEAERFERKELKSISYTIYENKEVILFLNPNLDFFNRNLSEKSQYKIDFALSIKDTQNKYFLSHSVEYNTFIKMLPKDSYRYIDARRILVKPLKKEDIYLLSKKCYKEFIRIGGKNDRSNNWRCYWKFL